MTADRINLTLAMDQWRNPVNRARAKYCAWPTESNHYSPRNTQLAQEGALWGC